MNYHLVITKEEPNPNYKEPADHPSWSNHQTTSELPTRTVRTLEAVLTDEEFAAVKKACIEAMK